jgi:hypothetical protein
MKGIMKWPLIVAAVVTVVRVLVERAGASEFISGIFGVVWLHLLIVPLYFAFRIANSAQTKPYATQFKLAFLYVVLARLMILPTYWLGYIYQWPPRRFAQLIGPDVTPFVGYIGVPLFTAVQWIVASTIVGGVLGCIVILFWRQFIRKPAPTSVGV